MTVIRLALQSLASRWVTAVLTVLAIAFSVMLFLGVEKVRAGARASFADTISGTDLIVGARSSPVQLLLYSVFRIGNATNNIRWTTFRAIEARADVAWAVPISLGDSHRGFRVMGTTKAYFAHYSYRSGSKLTLAGGAIFDDLYDAVIGSDVAELLGYDVGTSMVVAHGLGDVSFALHDDKPFRVAGILAKTGTPVDRTVHVSLEAIEAIHADWSGGARDPTKSFSAEQVRQMDLTPKAITAVFVGLKSRLQVFRFQRAVNGFRGEPITAVLPGVALAELWEVVGQAEAALQVVSGMVIVTALIGMITMLLATLNERRRELAILRSVGAGPGTIIGLLLAEAGVLTLAGVMCGAAGLYAMLYILRDTIDAAYGVYIQLAAPTAWEWQTLAAIVCGGVVAGLVPAFRAYRQSLADGMMVRH
ncbi:MAG: FtsX-like permease family protein [Pseudomonadota bacterium]